MATEAAKIGVFTQDQCERLAHRIFGMISGADVELSMYSEISTSTSFSRGDAQVNREERTVGLRLVLIANERQAQATTTRIDDEGIRLLVAEAEAAARQWRGKPEASDFLGPQVYKTPPKIFFEENLKLMPADGRAWITREALDAAEAAGLIAAGDVQLSQSAMSLATTKGLFTFSTGTSGEFSMTARSKDGTGSGWAWGGHEDWSRVKAQDVIARAVDLGRRSMNPVAVEPGRHTVILEPAAVATLIDTMIHGPTFYMDAGAADRGNSVYSRDPLGSNKEGLQMLDRRLSMDADPWDPELPQNTIGPGGEPVDKTTWFDRGILKTLSYSRAYARQKGRPSQPYPRGVRLFGHGPTQTLEEMIAGTKRGIWINRLSNVFPMNGKTLLLSGTTRDGTFLIENGKITKPIKNFRFTDSPFFVLNQLEAFGKPVRAPGYIVCPRLKVRDFDFTSLTDAV